MLGCLLEIFLLPVIYGFLFVFELIIFVVKIPLIIFRLIFGNKFNSNVDYEYYSNSVKKNKNLYKNKGFKDAFFEEKSKLYGLSKDDMRIAKEEGMDPDEFVEAEERDDDNLDTDEF